MYEAFYKLKVNPFRLTADPGFLYMTAQHREALAGLTSSVYTRPGLTVLVGDAGTGKSTVLNALLRLLDNGRFITALCNNPRLSGQEFYDFCLNRLNVECSSTLKSQQLLALNQTLSERHAQGKVSVLIIDEAQRLSADLLEEIRLLLNMETPQQKLLEVIISGQPELMETLNRPELRQFKQRVNRICWLNPLNIEDIKRYIDHRLAKAGLPQQTLFGDELLPLIFEYTQGLPRLINNLCDNALQTGFALQTYRITESIIREAANDLALSRSLEPMRVTAAAAAAVTANAPESEPEPRPEILTLAEVGAAMAPPPPKAPHTNGTAPAPMPATAAPRAAPRPAKPAAEPIAWNGFGLKTAEREKTGFFASVFGRWKN